MKHYLDYIDFSNGICSEEINNNFKRLQDQINIERLSVAGQGISSGLQLNIKDFDLNVSEGYVVGNTGEEVYIPSTTINIEKPILIAKEETLKVNKNNTVTLQEIPYATNRLMNSAQADSSEYGITLSLPNAYIEDLNLDIVTLENKTITINNPNNYETIVVNYYYVLRRLDIVFINKKNEIDYRIGTSSASPSIPELDKDEYLYILGYILVDGMALTAINKYNAIATIIQEFNSVRNVYTDSNNELYLCGTPFSAIKIINIVEPKNPKVGTFWYDESVNELKVWRKTDNYTFSETQRYLSENPNNPQIFTTIIKYLPNRQQLQVYINGEPVNRDYIIEGIDLNAEQINEGVYSKQFKINPKLFKLNKNTDVSYKIVRYDGYEEWVSVNNKNCINCEERYIWTPEILENEVISHEHDLRNFYFDYKEQHNLFFVPNTNSIKILINQVPLHSDQFEEITLNDVFASEDAQQMQYLLKTYYGYKDDIDINDIHEEYENIGIGFRLAAPLDRTTNNYIEIQVTQRVNSNPIGKRFQRSSTFIYSDVIEYNDKNNNDNIFLTNRSYRYKENQLELYINGLLQIKNKDYEEVCDKEEKLIGTLTDKFKLLKQLNNGDIISYRITYNVYSYDHVDQLFENFKDELDKLKAEVTNSLNKFDSINDDLQDKYQDLNKALMDIKNLSNDVSNNYIRKNTELTADNFPKEVLTGVKAYIINQIMNIGSAPAAIQMSSDPNYSFSNNDLITVYNTKTNTILLKGQDYEIIDGGIRIKNNNSIMNSTLYVYGIKFKEV